ncbi:CaiB/BaiF CoA transferase family protein [Actinophytocola oryzae]|uniref:Alpha-methylacyl-CoA racemase n=1 Tax=Actinophytocola oryzae TaxID=502181 RepID=A0A4R7VAY3_9PSEU|nr:CaiB/BaiF CoA-transferase family protein [Actinophytocola oryzae]TDV46163.1 alpha-methylacyl-CoA racemase [Actinophytocola oryzae]
MGPLAGLKVVELVGLAPAPFAATVLADYGADVVRVDRVRPGFDVPVFPRDPLSRSRRWIGVDTKSPEGRDIVLRLVEEADVLVEGYRPGVTERLGLGPDDCLSRNPRLVYGRITGWGQDGPLAQTAGHDINYISVSGALEPIGRAGERPVPPLNLLGDFGGGGMLLAMGVMAALVERSVSGRGQVVDASMVEGSALLTAGMHGLRNLGLWGRGRGANMLDGGAPFYDTYETADGRYVAVGAIEERFWTALLRVLEIDPATVEGRLDPEQWTRVRAVLAEVIRTRTRDEWASRAEGTDACLTPVLDPSEAPSHPHNVARGTFVTLDGDPQPAPAPRFSRTVPAEPTAPVEPRSSTSEVLTGLGYKQSDIDRLRTDGVVA